ncbi:MULTISPECIES: hypothetical protein [Nocardia]|uniref:Uncharacterized protein n=2 Tax=Nocardia TaxID=1817 RepID=A0A2T2Z9W3_9NOCA|nr:MULTISPECIES: hypothetical protein [Nocardia]PSR64548.1 hypothetical protein C8259_05775 [Nocardia nova]
MHAELDGADEADDHRRQRDVEDRRSARIARLERVDIGHHDRYPGPAARLGGRGGDHLGHRRTGRTRHIDRDPRGGAHVQDGEHPLRFDGLARRLRGVVVQRMQRAVQFPLHGVEEALVGRRHRGPRVDDGDRDPVRCGIGEDIGVGAGEQSGRDRQDEHQHRCRQERWPPQESRFESAPMPPPQE